MLCSISETSLHHKMATQRVDHFVLGVLARVPEGSGVNMHGFLSNWLHKLVVNINLDFSLVLLCRLHLSVGNRSSATLHRYTEHRKGSTHYTSGSPRREKAARYQERNESAYCTCETRRCLRNLLCTLPRHVSLRTPFSGLLRAQR